MDKERRPPAVPAPSSIYLVHAGRANYPELRAYRQHLADRGRAAEVTFSGARAALAAASGAAPAICWHMMGFYPRRLRSAFVIHDYRSLSVGAGRTVKDRAKALLNHRPDLRIYQNASIRRALGFSDGVPELYLPMGVPDDIARHRQGGAGEALGDFCYAGSMLRERRIDRTIASFLRRYGNAKSLWLYGVADDRLRTAFRDHANVVFAGAVPQDELFAALGRFRACVCYFPNHYPHVLQTPTKLLEYAALGLRVIANEQPQSRSAAAEFGIAAHWGPADDMFRGAPDVIDWPDNASLDPSPLLWSAVIRRSGIDEVLAPVV